MNEQYSRGEWLLGEGSTERLRQAHVAVFGLGGVGSYIVEALARMGVYSRTEDGYERVPAQALATESLGAIKLFKQCSIMEFCVRGEL